MAVFATPTVETLSSGLGTVPVQVSEPLERLVEATPQGKPQQVNELLNRLSGDAS